jgi:hypothetical protein
MNYILHLSGVFEKMDSDSRLSPFHISLYMALFRRWNLNFFNNPISVSRDELMRLSKIGSVNTYTKSLKALDRFGYIKYEPSYNPHRGSLIYLYSFDNGTDKGCEQEVIPYKNNAKNTNQGEQTQKRKDKMRKEPKNKREASDFGPDVPPMEEHVLIYFEEKGYLPVEAEKFFNYFQSNGWLVGGRTKMKDWKAAARNWILNADKFNHYGMHQRNHPSAPKPGKLRTSPDKNYSEPL